MFKKLEKNKNHRGNANLVLFNVSLPTTATGVVTATMICAVDHMLWVKPLHVVSCLSLWCPCLSLLHPTFVGKLLFCPVEY